MFCLWRSQLAPNLQAWFPLCNNKCRKLHIPEKILDNFSSFIFIIQEFILRVELMIFRLIKVETELMHNSLKLEIGEFKNQRNLIANFLVSNATN